MSAPHVSRACPVCGLDEPEINVPDAIATLRTLPRRYREAFAGIADDAARERPAPEAWSMLEHAGAARLVIDRMADALRDARQHAHAVLPAAVFDDVEPGTERAVAVVLAEITTAAPALADLGDSLPWAAWDRTVTVGDRILPIRRLLQHAAHRGVHELREAERLRARVLPAGDADERDDWD